MKSAHSYIAAFLLAIWWLLRERWDTLPTFAAIDMPWYAILNTVLMLAVLAVLCGKQIQSGAVAGWGWVATRTISERSRKWLFLLPAFFIPVTFAAGLWVGRWIPFPPPSPPKPDVVVPTPIEGPLSIFLIHEAKEKTPALARTITDLRAGAAADYLAKQKHSLLILDDDSKDANGEPSAVLKQWREKYATVKLPAVLIVAKSGAVLHADTLKDGATADNIVELVRAKEGK